MTARPGSATSGALRRARGCAFAGAAAWLAAVAHVGGGGQAPSATAVVLVGALCGAAGVNLSARRAGSLRIAMTLAPLQVGAHALFEIFGDPAAAGPAAGAAAGHGHHVMVTATDLGAAAPAGGRPMLALHGLAVLATALLLAHGDRAVWRLVAWLTAVLSVIGTAPRTVGAFPPSPAWSTQEVAPVVRPGRSSVSRRGPPAVLATR